MAESTGSCAMANVEAADAAGEVNVAIAVHVFEPGIFRFRDVHRRGVRQSARHGSIARRSASAFDFGTGDRWFADSNSFAIVLSTSRSALRLN